MKVRQIYAFVVRDIKVFLSDKTALFWLIAWPLIWILLTAYIFVPPTTGRLPIRLTVGVVNYDIDGIDSADMKFIEILSNVTYEGIRIFDVKLYSNESQLVRDLKQSRLDIGIVIPVNFSTDLMARAARLKVLVGAKDVYSASINYGIINGFLNEFSRRIGLAKADTALTYFEKSLEHIDQAALPFNTSAPWLSGFAEYVRSIAAPLNVVYEEVKPEAFTRRENILGWYTIGAIGMMFLYSGFSYGASAIYREKGYGSLRRIVASPITPFTLIVALILSNIVILLVSALLLLLAGIYIAGANILFNPANPVHWLAPLLLVVAAYMSLGVGLTLSLFAKTSYGAGSLGTALGLFLAFTAGIWFPRSWMPQWLQVLADYFPITWVMDTIRNIMVYNMDLDGIWMDLVKIAFALIVIIILNVWVYKVRLKKTITSY